MSLAMKMLPGSERLVGRRPAFVVSPAIMMISTFRGGSSSTKPEPVVPGAYIASESHLYWSELTATGTDRLSGTIRTAAGAAFSVADMARAPDGRLHAISFSQLCRLETETAIATPPGPGLPDRTHAVCFNGAGEFFATTANTGTLCRIDPATGGVTPPGTHGASGLSGGDLVLRPDGALLAAIARPGDAQDDLATVNVSTGAATVTRSVLPSRMHGMGVFDGVVSGATAVDAGCIRSIPPPGPLPGGARFRSRRSAARALAIDLASRIARRARRGIENFAAGSADELRLTRTIHERDRFSPCGTRRGAQARESVSCLALWGDILRPEGPLRIRVGSV